MKIGEIISAMEQLAPPSLQESYDNCGLITGHQSEEAKGALVCLDCTEEVLDEAITLGCNLVIAHHPIVFSGLKKLNGKNYVERVIIKAIKNDIAIYAIHTNLDNVYAGVNQKIALKIGLKNTRILQPKQGSLCKLVTFAPVDFADKVRDALFAAGAGNISDYSECSFNIDGTGTFLPGAGTDPFSGTPGVRSSDKEVRIEVILETYLQRKAESALKKVHPYEEVAFDFYPLLNEHPRIGSGMIGELDNPIDILEFLKSLKTTLKTDCIRYTKPVKKEVQTIALCGGSGSFLLNAARLKQADVFITADYKYHQFFDADGKIVIADIGHYESEQFTGEIISDFLKDKFPTFAVRLTKVNTNPVNYL